MNDDIASKKLVIVLGMHRSGTSVISRGLKVLGVELGERLMPPNPEFNAKGYWEDLDFNTLNIEMLNALDIDWHYLKTIQRNDVTQLRNRGFHKRAIDLLHRKMCDSTVFGIKDPRISKLMPFWKEVFEQSGIEANYVLALRNPISVSKSLEKRDDLDVEKSYLLWLDHMLTGLAESRGAKRIMVDYCCLMLQPDAELRRIAKRLNLSIDMKEFEKYEHEFLDANLSHWNYKIADIQQSFEIPPLVREVFEVLYNVARDKIDIDSPVLSKQIESWLKRLYEMQLAMKLADKYWRNSGDLAKSVIEYRNQIAELHTMLGRRNDEIAELNQELSMSRNLATELDNELSEIRRQLDQVFSSNSWKVTRPLRQIRRWLNTPNKQAKRYFHLLLRLLKRFVQLQ